MLLYASRYNITQQRKISGMMLFPALIKYGPNMGNNEDMMECVSYSPVDEESRIVILIKIWVNLKIL